MYHHLALLCFLLAFTTAAQSGDDNIYKWTDDSGEVHYTQHPPQGRESVTVRRAPPPPGNPQAERSEQQQQVEQLDKQQQEAAKKSAEAELQAHNRKIREKNCATARKNLAELQQGGIKRYRLPSGEVVHMDEADRQKRIEEANKQIKENCKS
jgi:hypothetical protein